MKKIILCGGDSWTSGDIIDPELQSIGVTYVNHSDNDEYRLPKVWPHKLGKLLNVDVKNCAAAGCSNDTIVRDVMEHTLNLLKNYKNEDIFVIVGWTSPERKDFYYEYENESFWETMRPDMFLDKEQHGRINKKLRNFYESYFLYFWNEKEYISRYVNQNIYLFSFLSHHKINHLFFDAFYTKKNKNNVLGLHHSYEVQDDIQLDEHNTAKYFYDLRQKKFKNISFKNFLLNQSPKRDKYRKDLWSDTDPHPTELGHKLWAEELYKDLKDEYNYIKRGFKND